MLLCLRMSWISFLMVKKNKVGIFLSSSRETMSKRLELVLLGLQQVEGQQAVDYLDEQCLIPSCFGQINQSLSYFLLTFIEQDSFKYFLDVWNFKDSQKD